MDDLLTALAIMKGLLYAPDKYAPTACEHDVLYVCGIDMSRVSGNTVRVLASLGFQPGSDEDFDSIENILGHDFAIAGNFKNITDENWERVKGSLTDCFHSYRFGSC